MVDVLTENAFTYGEAETLLAKLHGAEAVQRLAFRGRMKHLKRVGIPLDTSVGQGKKQLYSEDHVWQWAFALELEQVNVDPTSIGKIMAAYWVDSIRPAYIAAKEASPLTAILFWIVPQFMNATWVTHSEGVEGDALGILEMGWVGSGELQTILMHRPHRYSIFSVSAAVRAVLEAKPALAQSSDRQGVAGASVRLPRRSAG